MRVENGRTACDDDIVFVVDFGESGRRHRTLKLLANITKLEQA
jgi:hypothetical protein